MVGHLVGRVQDILDRREEVWVFGIPDYVQDITELVPPLIYNFVQIVVRLLQTCQFLVEFRQFLVEFRQIFLRLLKFSLRLLKFSLRLF